MHKEIIRWAWPDWAAPHGVNCGARPTITDKIGWEGVRYAREGWGGLSEGVRDAHEGYRD